MTVPTRQYRYVVTVEPTVEPVTLAEAKLHLRVDNGDEDTYIESLITAARSWAENFTRRRFVNTTLRLSLDEFPDEIRLPGGKTQSISSFAYTDSDGAAATLSSGSTYTLDSDSEPARLVPYYNTSWPATRAIPNAIQITYVAGYGSAASNVPAGIKHAIKIMVANQYEFREPNVTGTIIQDVPLSVQSLLIPFCVPEFY